MKPAPKKKTTASCGQAVVVQIAIRAPVYDNGQHTKLRRCVPRLPLQTVVHAHWNELLLETGAVLAESGRPLRRGEDRSEIVGRKDGNSSVASLQRAVHVQNEVA